MIEPIAQVFKTAKEQFIGRCKLVKEGIYQVGQIIVDGIYYAGTADKKKSDNLRSKLPKRK